MKRDNNKGLLHTMVNVFELPPEVILNTPLLTVTGQEKLTLENYTSLTEYNDKLVKINTPESIITICGENIKVNQISKDVIIIEGKFTKIEYG